MGKIVKYCAACEESFAEKFTFCPDCGKEMKAFEMNPISAEKETSSEPVSKKTSDVVVPSRETKETSPISEPINASGSQVAARAGDVKNFDATSDDDFELDLFDDDEPEHFKIITPEDKITTEDRKVETAAEAVPPATAGASAAANVVPVVNGNGNGKKAPTVDAGYQKTNKAPNVNDSGFHVAIIEEKNVKQRNMLLLGAFVLMLTLTVGGVIYSIFNSPLFVGAIGDESSLYAFVPEVEEVPMEVEEVPKKNPDKGGGGGGGGREEETPTSQGRLATQTEKPQIAPDKSIVQLTNPSIPIIASTQGNVKRTPTTEQYGDPNSRYTLSSNGMGSGGGQGSGVGTGQGSGRGTGQGSGLGSGSGSGDGSGNGSGTGRGDNGSSSPPPPPPKEPVGVTEGLKILSKPKANYTDAARTNQIQGVVRLRVTFSASGAIAGITPVSGLPYGLTEQAIAAARQIRFEPAKRNGVPQSATKILEYSFTIY